MDKPAIAQRGQLLENDNRCMGRIVRSAISAPMPMGWPRDDQRHEEQ